MKFKQTLSYLVVFFVFSILLLITSCAPRTFIKTMTHSWNSVEIRKDLTYDQAWNSVVDLISKKFDIEILSKEDGYLRTGWLYSWTGKLKETYKVRAVIKFSPDKNVVEVKSEAQHYSKGFLGIGSGWIMGKDELLTTTLRTDIMGKVGRVAR